MDFLDPIYEQYDVEEIGQLTEEQMDEVQAFRDELSEYLHYSGHLAMCTVNGKWSRKTRNRTRFCLPFDR